jgi:MFS transporter, ACDE family, multidrug resistance protein
VTPTLLLLLIPLVLFGVAQGVNLPNVSSLLNAHAPNENRGAFMATNGMALRTGQTVGPLLMASLAGAYLATAIIALVALFSRSSRCVRGEVRAPR